MKSLFISFLLFNSISFVDEIPSPLTDVNDQYITVSKAALETEKEDLKDCDFRIIVENSDGTSTEYHITVHDVSWWTCTKLQIGAWWDRNF